MSFETPKTERLEKRIEDQMARADSMERQIAEMRVAILDLAIRLERSLTRRP